jgi:hypothetical protein
MFFYEGSGLVRRWGQGKVAYMKPLGQRYVDVTLPNGMVHKVDRDVEVVRRTFGLKDPWECMSPVVFPPGYTRDCIDGKVLCPALPLAPFASLLRFQFCLIDDAVCSPSLSPHSLPSASDKSQSTQENR